MSVADTRAVERQKAGGEHLPLSGEHVLSIVPGVDLAGVGGSDELCSETSLQIYTCVKRLKCRDVW